MPGCNQVEKHAAQQQDADELEVDRPHRKPR